MSTEAVGTTVTIYVVVPNGVSVNTFAEKSDAEMVAKVLGDHEVHAMQIPVDIEFEVSL